MVLCLAVLGDMMDTVSSSVEEVKAILYTGS